MQCVVVHCSVMQYAMGVPVLCCCVLWCVAVCCCILQCDAVCHEGTVGVLQFVVVCCGVLQCDAVCYSVP